MKAAGARPARQALVAQHEHIGDTHLRDLSDAEPERSTRWTVSAAGLCVDHSKNRIDGQTLAPLTALAQDRGLEEHIAAMFRGEAINTTEQRMVLHAALRAPPSERLWVGGVDRQLARCGPKVSP